MSLSRLTRTGTVPPSVERYLVLVPPDGAQGTEETEADPAPPASTLPPHYQRLSARLPRSPLLLSSSSYSSLSFSSSAIPITVRPSTTQNESESESESERESEAEGEQEEAVDHQEDPPLAAADESASGGAATTVVWRPDHEVELCTECGARFTLILRKVPTLPLYLQL
jgi:hypothetical protein